MRLRETGKKRERERVSESERDRDRAVEREKSVQDSESYVKKVGGSKAVEEGERNRKKKQRFF